MPSRAIPAEHHPGGWNGRDGAKPEESHAHGTAPPGREAVGEEEREPGSERRACGDGETENRNRHGHGAHSPTRCKRHARPSDRLSGKRAAAHSGCRLAVNPYVRFITNR